MNPQSLTRLFDPTTVRDDRLTLMIVAGLAIAMALVPLVVMILAKAGKINDKLRGDIMQRYKGWLFIVPLLVGPILLGTALPAHILSPTVTSRGVVNMAALAAVQASHPSV